jgi:hypothetical protein
MKMDRPQTTQSVQYRSLSSTNKLPSPSLLRPSTRHARLHGVLGLGQKYMDVGQWSPPPPPQNYMNHGSMDEIYKRINHGGGGSHHTMQPAQEDQHAKNAV